MECVATDDLMAMLDGTLTGERVEAVLVHVDACEHCAEIIANLARDSAPRIVGRYRLGRVLGAGGMGVVHEAWDPELRRRVAVKLVRPEQSDDESRARMLREARALARINHPNVVAVFDVGEAGGEIYVATELVDGETMATWAPGRDMRVVIAAWLQAAYGLAAAHAEGFVHRDVKPANVLVGRDGRVRIGDFGLARIGDAPTNPASRPPSDSSFGTITDGAHVGGTPAYMAPEQWHGRGDARSDQFALGVAISETIASQRPAPDTTPAIADPKIAAVLARAIRSDPTQRFPSVDAFGTALAHAIAPPRRRGRWIAIAGIAGLAAGAAIFVAAMQARDSEPACEVVTIPDAMWSAADRAKIEKWMPAGLVARVDAWMTAWRAMASDVCVVDDPPALRERRRRCLTDALGGIDVSLSKWKKYDGPALQTKTWTASVNEVRPGLRQAPTPLLIEIALDTWDPVARCSSKVVAMTPAPSPEQEFAITGLRAQMLNANNLEMKKGQRKLGSLGGVASLATYRAVAAQARNVGFDPFIVEVDIEVAKRLEKRDDKVTTLRAAIERATRAREARGQAAATAALIALLGRDQIAEATKLADAARAALAAAGGDAVTECDVDNALAEALSAAGRKEEAVAAYENARRNCRAGYGPDSMHEMNLLGSLDGTYTGLDWDHPGGQAARDALVAITARTGTPRRPSTHDGPDELIPMIEAMIAASLPGSPDEANGQKVLGLMYTIVGREEDAIAHYQRALDLAKKAGRRDAETAWLTTSIASNLVALARISEAIAIADDAVALEQAVGTPTDLATALTVQGAARIASKQVAAARDPLKKALDLRDKLRGGSAERSRTRFLYAQALWPIDKRSALGYAGAAKLDAEQALGSMPKNGFTKYNQALQQKRLDEIQRWIAKHDRR